MEEYTTTSSIIGFAVIWDEKKGPIIISEAPPRVIDDPISAITQIYLSIGTFLHTKEMVFSPETLKIPFYMLSQDHVVLVNLDHCKKVKNQGTGIACFIAFIMPKSTANELKSFIPIAMQSFMRNFKQDGQNYSIGLARDILVSYLLNCGTRSNYKPILRIKGNVYRIAMAGLPRAGKTAILRRLKTGRFIENTRPTRGFDTEILESSIAKFQVMDLGGQEHYIHAFWRSFLLKSHALIFVIDINNRETFEKARLTLQKAINWNPAIQDLIVLVNKKDLVDSIGVKLNTLLDTLNLPSMLSSSRISNFKVFTTSARTGEGLEEAFRWLAQQMTGQEDFPINILSAHIFRKTGHPIVSSYAQGSIGLTANKVAHIDMMPPKEDTSLISGFYSVIGSFVRRVFDGKISNVEIKGFSGKSYRLVNVEKDDLFCLLLVEIGDKISGETIEAIGNELLDYVSRQQELQAPIEKNKLHSLINPFYSGDIPSPRMYSDKKNFHRDTEKNYLSNGSDLKRYDSYFFTSLSVKDRMRSKGNAAKETS